MEVRPERFFSLVTLVLLLHEHLGDSDSRRALIASISS